jgi:starch phosphorylase
VDVWLNNPRRPKEASGTSGMKVIYNGGLNFSILDGWWDEGYTPDVGWAIGSGEEYPESDAAHQDFVESEALYNVLENDIIPTFYDRRTGNVPRAWVTKVKNAMMELSPFFNTHRMVQEYTNAYYIPFFNRFSQLTTPTIERGLEFAVWRERLERAWSAVKVINVNVSEKQIKVGNKLDVSATVHLGELKPEDVRVELYYGPLSPRGEIMHGEAQPMRALPEGTNGQYVFNTQLTYRISGERGISVRVLPENESLTTPFVPGIIRWA